MSQYVVCALYKFVELNNYQELREPLLALMEKHHIRGTLLLAGEGMIQKCLWWILATITKSKSAPSKGL